MPKQVIFGVGDEFLRRDGLTGTVQPWEDGLRTDPRGGEFEWWYFDTAFEDGSKAVIVFYTKSILNPRGVFKPGITLTFTRPDGTKIFASSFVEPSDFSSSKKGLDIRLGKSWVKGSLRSAALSVCAEGLSADLTFESLMPAWRPGSGRNYYDPGLKSYFAWLPAIPFGSAKGTLTYDGKPHTVAGSGYHDHNWGNVRLPDVMSHWYWGRATVADFHTIFVEMHSHRRFGSQKIPVFLLARRDKVLTDDARFLTLTTGEMQSHPSGHSFPHELDFRWNDGSGNALLSLRHPQVIESSSLLGFLPAWQQKLIRLVANPYYFRFSADLDLTVDLPKVHAHEKGSAIYEIMLLH